MGLIYMTPSFDEDDESLYDPYEEDAGDDEDGVGGECMLTVERGIYSCGMAGSEDCEFDCIYHNLIGKRATRSKTRD